MSSSKEFRDFILEQIFSIGDISCKSMMGEFLLYYKGILFGGIYDDRLLIKRTNTNVDFNLLDAIPYQGAKPMYLVENLEDREYLKSLILLTCCGLKNK